MYCSKTWRVGFLLLPENMIFPLLIYEKSALLFKVTTTVSAMLDDIMVSNPFMVILYADLAHARIICSNFL
jgi:hypothetical protein